MIKCLGQSCQCKYRTLTNTSRPLERLFFNRSINIRAIAYTSFILGSGSSVKEGMTWKIWEKILYAPPSSKSFCGKLNCVLNAKIHTDLKILIFKECCHGNPYLLSFPTLHMWETFSSFFFSPVCGSSSSPSAITKKLASNLKRCQTGLLFSWKLPAKKQSWADLERDAKVGAHSHATEKGGVNIFQQFLFWTRGK